MLVKNRKFDQKSKIWSKIEILVKHLNIWLKIVNFGQQSKVSSKIESFAKTRKFCQKSKVWSKIFLVDHFYSDPFWISHLQSKFDAT